MIPIIDSNYDSVDDFKNNLKQMHIHYSTKQMKDYPVIKHIYDAVYPICQEHGIIIGTDICTVRDLPSKYQSTSIPANTVTRVDIKTKGDSFDILIDYIDEQYKYVSFRFRCLQSPVPKDKRITKQERNIMLRKAIYMAIYVYRYMSDYIDITKQFAYECLDYVRRHSTEDEIKSMVMRAIFEDVTNVTFEESGFTSEEYCKKD